MSPHATDTPLSQELMEHIRHTLALSMSLLVTSQGWRSVPSLVVTTCPSIMCTSGIMRDGSMPLCIMSGCPRRIPTV